MGRAGHTGGVTVLSETLNLRDLGGHVTQEGRQVRGGVVYRSAALVPGDDAVRVALAGLGLRRVYDLRTELERAQQPDEVPAGAELVVLDVFGDSADLAPAQLTTMLDNPATAALR